MFDALGHAAQVQSLALYDSAARICGAAGTSIGNIVRAQYFMTDATQFPSVALSWARRQGNAPHPFVCVQVPGNLPAPGATVMADFWIYAP